MLAELEIYINKDPYTQEWKKGAYKKLCIAGLSDVDILFVLQGHVDHPTYCREWCNVNLYPFSKVWEVVK